MFRARTKYASDDAAKQGQKFQKALAYKRNREYVIRAKSKPCLDCGIQYSPWVMQFDHRDPENKRFELSALHHKFSLKKIQAEIEKCDVVCGNCHAERTHRTLAHLHVRVLKGGQ